MENEIEKLAKFFEFIYKKQREEELKRVVEYKKELDYNIENKDYKDSLSDVQQISYFNDLIRRLKLKIKIDEIREQKYATRSNREWDKYTKLEDKAVKELNGLYSTPFNYSGYEGIKDIKGSSLDRFGKKAELLAQNYYKAKENNNNSELLEQIDLLKEKYKDVKFSNGGIVNKFNYTIGGL
jgi:hypothetical protein